MTDIEHKRSLIAFLIGNPKQQPELFRKIINKELQKMKEYINEVSKDEENSVKNKILRDAIYISKVKEIHFQTEMLKEQIIAQEKGIKHPSIISILDRKLYIVNLQLDVGVYNLIHNKHVNFYFDT